ncbi:hypothetical protein G4B88_001166 [Cannabis sativa]|uniref:Patatin n=1 Tax=Cannabis sativa TaxID=3483 RepID=A0A7J6GFY3_CANSA|nr:hypothetical protein G4B88_001166 [Cannabis sativa]
MSKNDNMGVGAGTTTILSIDGGGVRGIIPGVMLDFLESKLQEFDKDNKNARLADYFDVISGTSTGGLIATMISTSNDEGRPLYAAKDIVPFYKRECPQIFNKSCSFCSHYDGTHLHNLVKEILGEKVLSEITLTKVVIPAYDIKKLSPVIFSSYEVQENKNVELDACLKDICISTSAAPTFLPAYKFTNKNTEFNMIDGGIAANNPKRKKDTNNEDGDQSSEDHHDYGDLLVLSLGTGAEKVEGKYNADMVNKWTKLNWMQNPLVFGHDYPIIEIMGDANADMIDHYTTMFFHNYEQNFLRIQDSELPKDLSAMDNVRMSKNDNMGVGAGTTTILSIDGGGVRGIIPGVMLDFLESKLQIESLFPSFLYDGKYLHDLVRNILGEKVLSDTLTKVVIPAYDIKKLSPVLENKNKELDAYLSDICLSTSAAPIYFPAYKFTNENTEFNMIDGGIAANNPTVAAITEVKKRKRIKVDHPLEKGKGRKRKKDNNNNNEDGESSEDHDYGDLLVLSLGTGADKVQGKYNADMDSALPKDLSAMDNSNLTNLKKLEQYAKDLLQKPVTRLDLPTFKRIVMNESQTYQDALEEFAKKLIFIKKSRAEQAVHSDH